MQRLKAIKYIKLTIKKILNVLLETCEFDRDDYSLNVISVPDIEDEELEDIKQEKVETSSEEPSLFD